MTLAIQVPSKFWHDHYDRCGNEGTAEVLHSGQRMTLVILDQAAWDNLYGDADYYATQDFGVWGHDMRGLIDSARATLRRMKAFM
jgi:hypothetical protein